MDLSDLIREAYRNFNARNLEAVLSLMHPDVVWPNGMEGGFVYGKEAVRDYWTRQWAVFDPKVEPVRIEPGGSGRWVVDVYQVVRDLSGKVVVDTMVRHTYQFHDGLIVRMDIE